MEVKNTVTSERNMSMSVVVVMRKERKHKNNSAQ